MNIGWITQKKQGRGRETAPYGPVPTSNRRSTYFAGKFSSSPQRPDAIPLGWHWFMDNKITFHVHIGK
jgi:hypothetical protein